MALAANALTTVATLADELGIDEPASGSAALRDLERRIAVASSAIGRYCDRIFGAAEYTEAVAGYGTAVLRVAQYPVSEVESVSLDSVALPADSHSCAGQDARVGFVRYLYGTWADTASLQCGGAPEPMAGTEALAYSVAYSAGYVLPKDATEEAPATLPPEIEEACLQECVASYRGKGRDVGIRSETMLGASVSYDVASSSRGASGLLVTSERMLAPH